MKKIPVHIAEIALRENRVNPLKLYLYLKYNCDGMIRFDKSLIQDACSVIGYNTKKTFHNNLKKLISFNWVGFDKDSGYYFVRSYNFITKKRKRRASFDFNDFKDFRGYLCGVVIKKCCQNIRYGFRKDKKNVAIKSDIALQRSNKSGELIANSYLQKSLGVKYSKARRIKHRMALSGYGFVKRFRNKLDNEVCEIKWLNALTDSRYVYQKNGVVYMAMPDLCGSYV